MKQPRNTINGWINLNKPLGITSSDAVNKVKWLLKPSKIGHAGTLDPLASGVLPLALGEGTKCINLLMDAKKTYEFSVTFGERRNTDDAEGEVVATSDHLPSAEAIRAVLPQFTGEISQIPPIFSALKVDGKRAYDLARAGEAVELKARNVTVYALECLGVGERTIDEKSAAVPPPLRGRLGGGAVQLRKEISPAHQEKIQGYAQDLRNDATEAEKKLWHHVRGEQIDGLKFRRQVPIDDYIADFACLECKLIVELDGGQHAANLEADMMRTAYMQSQGFSILRFWNHDVMENIEGVVATIENQLRRPPIQPSPARGEGSARGPVVAQFRAIVSKGTYIRSLGRDIAQAVGSEGYISRLHRSAVGPFTDGTAISLDFVAESVHKAPPNGGIPSFVLPLDTALDDIPALALAAGQLATLRHGQQVSLAEPYPDTALLGAMHEGQLVGLVKVEGNQVISVRLLNVDV